MKDLKLPEFNHIDFKVMSEFVKVMRPIAKALNELQGEHQSFYCSVLPTLLEIQCRLNKLEDEPLTFCRPLAQQLLSGLTKRYGDFLGLKEEDPTIKMAILATTSHPNFKLRWLTI